MTVRSVPRFGFWVNAFLLGLFGGHGAALAYDDNEVRAIVLNQVEPESFPGQGGVWMAQQRFIYIDGMGNSTIEEHLLARVFDPKWGQTRFGDWTLPYWSALQGIRVTRARVWHGPDAFTDLSREAVADEADPMVEGIKPYLPRRRVSVHFRDLKRGDVVELRYVQVDNVQGGELNVRYGEFDYGAEDPVIEQELILKVPDALEPKLIVVGDGVVRRKLALGELKQFHFLFGNIPALGREVLSTPYNRIASGTDSLPAGVPRVLFSTVSDLPYLVDYYGYRWYGHAQMRESGMNLKVSELTAKRSETGERARAIEAYVQKEIRTLPIASEEPSFRPLDAAEIFRAGAGSPRDKALLLYSLLRGAGLRATPALVRARAGAWRPELPVFSQFDRVLLRLETRDQGTLWLDPIESVSPLPAGRALLLPPRDERTDNDWIEFPGR